MHYFMLFYNVSLQIDFLHFSVGIIYAILCHVLIYLPLKPVYFFSFSPLHAFKTNRRPFVFVVENLIFF